MIDVGFMILIWYNWLSIDKPKFNSLFYPLFYYIISDTGSLCASRMNSNLVPNLQCMGSETVCTIFLEKM